MSDLDPCPTAAPLLHVHDLHFAWPGQPPLLNALQLALPAGVSALGGDSGSGKSTLLALLAGQLQPQRGRVVLTGSGIPPGQTREPGGAGWGHAVFAFDHRAGRDDPQSTESLLALLRARHAGWHEATFERHAQAFGLAPHRGKPLLALSTGTRHKLWLAAALAAQCALTLLDEPSAGLDAPSLDHLFESLAELADPALNPDRVLLIASGEPLDEVLPLAVSVTLPAPAGA